MNIVLQSILALWVLALSLPAGANLQSQKLSTDIKLPAPRWMYDPQQTVEGNAVIKTLAGMKWYYQEKNWSACIQSFSKLAKLAPSLKPWTARQRILCAQKLAEEKDDWKPLQQATFFVENHPEWLVKGPYSESLNSTRFEAMTQLLELQVKSSRKAAWKTFETLQAYEKDLTDEQRARVFRLGGELAFVEQNLRKALGFFERSFEAQKSKEVSDRLVAIRSRLLGEKVEAGAAQTEVAKDKTLYLGEEENGIYERMQKALAAKDFVSAVEDGVKLIVKFPGGAASSWAEDQILRIYLTVAGESREEFRLLQSRVIKQMKDADPERLMRWATNAYWRTYYPDALELAEEAYQKYEGQSQASKALYIAGKSALYIGDNSLAKKHLRNLTEKYSGSEETEEALFLLGLHHIRQGEYSEAAGELERLLALSQNQKWIYRGLHWYWRALQKFNKEKSVEAAQRLESEFPLTYYGLRARAELNGNRLSWQQTTGAVSEEFWLSSSENLAWERYQILLKAGWFEEAQAELQGLPESHSPAAKVVIARLWGLALNHFKAIKLVNEAWDEAPELRSRSLIEMIFPKEFHHFVVSEVKGGTISPNLVYALIRQESSFRPEAMSHAGARGLMQLMLPTAQDMLSNAEKKSFGPEDLLRPDLNIRLGVRYLERLSRAFDGHLPITLAAYNAGIGRMRKWMASRSETKDLLSQKSSDPFSELWVDELPWDETSDYVKSVLRNYLIYQMLESGELALKDPLWLPSDS